MRPPASSSANSKILLNPYTGNADLRIYNTVRTKAEIKDDANNLSDTANPALVGHYTFSEFGTGKAGGGQQPWDLRNHYSPAAFDQRIHRLNPAGNPQRRHPPSRNRQGLCLGLDLLWGSPGLGDNTEGQTTIPQDAQAGVRQIAASHQVAYALKNDGTVIAWGKNDVKRLDTTGLTNIVKIADQDLTALFLEDSGKVHIRTTGDPSISDVSPWSTSVQDIASAPLANLALINGEATVIGSQSHGLTNVPTEAKSDAISYTPKTTLCLSAR